MFEKKGGCCMYQLQNVCLRLQETLVLNKIHLQINTGEFVYIVGPSGIGKSMLLKSLYGACPQIEGRIDWNGQKIPQFPCVDRENYRKQVSYMPQMNWTFSDQTVYEYLFYPVQLADLLKKNRQEEINRLLEKLHMQERGHNTMAQLSGGERQRVQFARALLKDCPIFLLDEPTSQLDPQMSDRIMEILEAENHRGKTIIMVTHDERIRKKFPKRTIDWSSEGSIK